ncbi:SAV_2336 N-terminal domain-related protein [Streptomyces sp. NPDC050803]|uniref:SAV_2336 N-terminal domain-related protein n=1 Tax=unclassified Streptomyces TaxID=2593676 RepID=UPI0034176E25
MPEDRSASALDEAVSLLRTVDPHLDATALAEALWLASRMAPSAAAEPDAGAPAAASAEAPADPAVPDPRTPEHPALSPQSGDAPARTLHERLPGSDARVSGQAVALPRASPLPQALELTRALRPWKRPWPRGRHRTLDVGATVDAYARSGELIPVFTPAPERWFDLVLVVDDSPSMQVWRETVSAFTDVLDRLGAFRTLQVRHLRPDSGSELTNSQGRSASAGQLGSPDGRRLVVVVSDCAAPAWREPEIWQQVRDWARGTPVALLNPLPPKLWRRTGLDLPAVRATQAVPGAGNTGLDFRLPPLLPPDSWLPVPVLSLSPHSLARWSRTVMLAAPDGCSAALVPAAGRPESPARHEPSSRRGPEARTEGFLRTASPAAARLAVLCSPFDQLSLDMLHVLREELVPEATTADVAEVLSSGLFALHAEQAGCVILRASPGVRDRLERELPEHEALRLSRTLSRRIASGHDGLRRLPVVVAGGEGADIAAEATPVGVAFARTLELLGLPPVALATEAETAVVLDDPLGHEPWLHPGRPRNWELWGHMRDRFTREGRPPAEIDRLDRTTNDVLARLEDPLRPGTWRRSGLVVAGDGAGRTTHAIGLTAKAIDAGYRAVVIVTGPTNAERIGVQSRVDEWLADWVSDSGVLLSLTTSEEDGDFSATRALMPPPPDSVPLVLVIKKNRHVIDRARNWLTQGGTPAARPLIVIDTANTLTTFSADDRSALDSRVHHLLDVFERTAYVNYSRFLPATDASDPTDLFPDHFIYHLPAPPDGTPRPPIGTGAREVTDYEAWMPVRHSADHVPGKELPDSLREAISAFVLSCAVRRARGLRSGTCMLVHVSQFAEVQARVRERVDAHVRFIAACIQDPARLQAQRLMKEFRAIWQSGPAGTPWAQVLGQLAAAAQEITVMRVSDAAQSMPTGENVLAVCGAQVPPEAVPGLTVSYQLRSSNDYARLVQLSHWSDGDDENLRRIYATPAILGIYRHLKTTTEEPPQPPPTVEDFSGTSVETLSFRRSPEVLRDNFRTLENFVHALDTLSPASVVGEGGNLVWQDVRPETVLAEFLDLYVPDVRPDREQLDRLSAYVRRCAANGELRNWTVQLRSRTKATHHIAVAGHPVGLVVRNSVAPSVHSNSYAVRRLLNPADQAADLDVEQYEAALELTRSDEGHRPLSPSAYAVRAVRRPDQPLLTIYPVVPPAEATGPLTPVVGFAIVFPYTPASGRARPEPTVS